MVVVPVESNEAPDPVTVKVALLIVRAALTIEGADSVSEPEDIFIGWLLIRLLTTTTLVILIVGLPEMTPIITSLVDPGRVLPVQLRESAQETPSPAPVHVAVAAKTFGTNNTNKTTTADMARFSWSIRPVYCTTSRARDNMLGVIHNRTLTHFAEADPKRSRMAVRR